MGPEVSLTEQCEFFRDRTSFKEMARRPHISWKLLSPACRRWSGNSYLSMQRERTIYYCCFQQESPWKPLFSAGRNETKLLPHIPSLFYAFFYQKKYVTTIVLLLDLDGARDVANQKFRKVQK